MGKLIAILLMVAGGLIYLFSVPLGKAFTAFVQGG
jgi:hypothetical protein